LRTLLNATAVLAIAGAATALGATSASATTVDECLASHPGAVVGWETTPGNDVVCVDSAYQPSEGNDLIFWVPSDESTGTFNKNQNFGSDPGNDTLSLADWKGPWTEDWNSAPIHASHFSGVRVFKPGIETVRLTSFSDTFGDHPDACVGTQPGDPQPVPNYTVYSLTGDDYLSCVVGGYYYTGTGADTVNITTTFSNAVVQTGDGGDLVLGSAGSDSITLGDGADVARVTKGSVDTVRGGNGADKVYASSNDKVFSATKIVR